MSKKGKYIKHLCPIFKYIKADARKTIAKKIPSANIRNEPFLSKRLFHSILDIVFFLLRL